MKNIKNSVIGLLGISFVIGGIIFDTSRSGRAATTNANKSEVVVVNNVDNPVISRVIGTTPVSIDPANNAVRIESSTPVQVQQVRQPFQAKGIAVLHGGSKDAVATIDMPTGMRVVIQNVAIWMGGISLFGQGENPPAGELGITSFPSGGPSLVFSWPLNFQRQEYFYNQDVHRYVANQSLLAYAEPGSFVGVYLHMRDAVPGDGTVEYPVVVTGYQEAVP
jgi:hypothetical protein